MTKNILALAVAAAIVAPLSVQAEIKVSGTIAAEVGSVEKARKDSAGNFVDASGVPITWDHDSNPTTKKEYTGQPVASDRTTMTDSDVSDNGSANKLSFDITEALGGGLTGFARIDWEFDTFNSVGDESNFKNREKYVGLKADYGHLKLGRIQGTYKTSTGGYDKFVGTGLQARNAGGGMSGGTFGHSSYVDDVLEVGFKAMGVKATVQYIADESVVDGKYSPDGSILGSLQYGADNWEVTAAAAYQKRNYIAGTVGRDGKPLAEDDMVNWKVGGKYTLGGLYLALQYESIETGSALGILPSIDANGNPDATDFIWGGVGYRMGNIELFGWVAGVGADFTNINNLGNTITNPGANSDVISYSVGAMYHFSKNTMAYAGYHETNSDAQAGEYDSNIIVGGMRLNF